MGLTRDLGAHHEDSKLRNVHVHLEVDPPQAWYYRIFPNFCTLVILLQVDFISGDELEIVCEGCYKTEDISIFTWFSILGVGYYHWLRGPICQLLSNNKADYLVRTI